MASARAALGRARRSMIKRKKTTGIVTGALSTLSTVAAFGAGQAKKADTAWKEYEAGYGEIPGADVADIKKPKFWQKGYFKGPEGEVQIGKGRKYKTYDAEQIRKAGSFLGSDASAILSDEQRQQYLERTAPGTQKIRHHDPTKSYSESYQQLPSVPEGHIGGVSDTGFVPTPVSPKHERMMRVRSATPPTTGSYQQTQIPARDILNEYVSGADPRGLQRMRVADSENVPEFNIQQPIDPSYEFSEGGGKPSIKRDISLGEALYDYKSLFEKTGIFPGTWEDKPGSKLPKSYAKGGDFITNGPQKIIVGDNPSGRERVTIKPLPSKDDEGKFGRFGDKLMKEKDGELVHISRREKNWSDEDLEKAVPFPTINPITGKKEYFLGAIAGALAIGSSLYKGYQATQNYGDIETGRTAAGDMYQEQLGLLGDVKTQAITGATQQAELGFDVTQSQVAAGQRNIGMGTNMELRRAQAFGEQAYSQSNLATSGTIQQKVGTQTGDVMAKYKSDMTKLFETTQLAGRERDLTISTAKEKADLSYRSGQMSAEDAYQSTLTGLESQPGASGNWRTNFLEGIFS